MTAADLRNEVINRYSEGQEVLVRIVDERTLYNVKAKIIKFNPNSILTEHNGFKESFSYYEFNKMTSPPKPEKLVIPDRLVRGAYSKKNNRGLK